MALPAFLQPKWKHPDPDIRKTAALARAREGNQRKLAGIANQCQFSDTLEIIIEAISDQTSLIQIVDSSIASCLARSLAINKFEMTI